MVRKRRVSISLSEEEYEHLSFVSDRFGFSKAATVTGVVQAALPSLYAMAEASAPRDADEQPEVIMKRVRGVSAELISEQIKGLME